MNESHKNIKNKILNELISLMDSKMVDGLKSKSPKFMKVETNDPEMAEEVVSGLEESSEEAPEEKLEEPMEEKSPEDADDMKRLMELYKGLK